MSAEQKLFRIGRFEPKFSDTAGKPVIKLLVKQL
jgi:hypothetical protein